MINKITGYPESTMEVLIGKKSGKQYKGLAVPIKAKFPDSINYTFMFEHGLKYLAKLRLRGTELCVLLDMISRLEYDNWIRVSQATIAEDLGLKRQHISIAIKKLVEEKIILREADPSDRRRLIYRLNPSLGWRGEPKEWFECAAEKDYEPIPPCFIRSKAK